MNGSIDSAAQEMENKRSSIAKKVVFLNNIFFILVMVVVFIVLTPISLKLKMAGDKSISAQFMMIGMLSYPLSLVFVHVGSKRLLEKKKDLVAVAIWMIPTLFIAIAVAGYLMNPNFFHPF